MNTDEVEAKITINGEEARHIVIALELYIKARVGLLTNKRDYKDWVGFFSCDFGSEAGQRKGIDYINKLLGLKDGFLQISTGMSLGERAGKLFEVKVAKAMKKLISEAIKEKVKK